MKIFNRIATVSAIAVSSLVLADIIIRNDGTVECTSNCHGTVNPTTGLIAFQAVSQDLIPVIHDQDFDRISDLKTQI